MVVIAAIVHTYAASQRFTKFNIKIFKILCQRIIVHVKNPTSYLRDWRHILLLVCWNWIETLKRHLLTQVFITQTDQKL